MKTLATNLTQTIRKWNPPILAIAIVFGMATCCSSALAQSGAGSIQGTVTDSTGAVIPGASIHVVNEATSIAADTTSNSVGFYQVPDLFTGTYTVTFTAPGMKTYKTAIELLVAQAAVIDPAMTAGAVTEQVEVAANAVQLTTTDNGTLTATLENDRINQLPMNGRMLLTLAGEVTPGLVSTGERANGLMPEALEYVADGVPEINRNFGGAGNNASYQAQLPDPDSVQQVRIETTNTSAMYSEPSTAIITTKSGTNGLHGSFSKLHATTQSASPRTAITQPTTLRLTWFATNLAPPLADRSFCPMFTTARIRASGSLPTSVIPLPRLPTSWCRCLRRR